MSRSAMFTLLVNLISNWHHLFEQIAATVAGEQAAGYSRYSAVCAAVAEAAAYFRAAGSGQWCDSVDLHRTVPAIDR
jgi:hypothetical protein